MKLLSNDLVRVSCACGTSLPPRVGMGECRAAGCMDHQIERCVRREKGSVAMSESGGR